MNRTIAAYTQPQPAEVGEYVEFVSINREPGHLASVHVRNRSGVAITISLGLDDLRKLALDVLAAVPE